LKVEKRASRLLSFNGLYRRFISVSWGDFVNRIASSSVMLLLAASFALPAKAADGISIATGNPEGLYYAAGQAICRTLALHPETAAMPCKAVATNGSISNILGLNAEGTQFAIVQADVQFNAVSGLGLFEATGPDQHLRAVLSLHSEAFAVLVPADSKVNTFADLRGSRFSAGQVGTGTRETAEALFEVLKWNAEDRARVVDMPVGEQAAALCGGKIDAAAFLTGHPSPLIMAVAGSCPVKLVQIPREASDQLAEKMVYYRPATIMPGTYPGSAQPVQTVGLRTALVTSADVQVRTVRAVTEAVFRSLGTIRDAAPAFAYLRPDEMSTGGLIAPLHPGALEYYRAVGLPTPSVQIVPSGKSPIGDAHKPGLGTLAIDPKLQVPDTPSAGKVQKPAYNTIPVGPDDKWKLESGDFGAKNPALTGDGDLPSAQDNIRLKIPTPN
jgi:TRAP transporter TAXI family solute receptor